MKTQLLQDFQESGSTPAAPGSPDGAAAPPSAGAGLPARAAGDARTPPADPPRRPAVWHGPGAQRASAGAAVQRADPGGMQRAPETPARGKGVAIEAWAERAAQGRSPQAPRPAAPAVGGAPVPEREARRAAAPPPGVDPAVHAPPFTAAPPRADPSPRPERPGSAPSFDPPPGAQAGADPLAAGGTIPRHPTPGLDDTMPRYGQPAADTEWLTARLREQAAQRETPAWSSMWKRRLVTWSIAGGLVAGLAAGGLWLYEENRVEDALVVVANTSPAGQGPARGAQAFAAATATPVPAQPAAIAAPVKTGPVAPEPAQQAPEPAAAAPAPVMRDPIATVDLDPPRRAARHGQPARKRTAAKPRRPAARDAPAVAAEPSPRERREETLMQCRAHGYDARQCIERACTMTRYGLACKG